jgi:hypothetical protein
MDSFPQIHRVEVAYYALTTLYTYANNSDEPKPLIGIELREIASVFHRSSVSVSSGGRQRLIGPPEEGGRQRFIWKTRQFSTVRDDSGQAPSALD